MKKQHRIAKICRFGKSFTANIALLASLAGCAKGGSGGKTTAAPQQGTPTTLVTADVTSIIERSVNHALSLGENVAVTVTERNGLILGEVVMNGVPADAQVTSESRGGVGAFFSTNQNAFSGETVAFIIQTHFPPENTNAPTGPLFGTEFSSFLAGDVVSVATVGNSVAPNLRQAAAGAGDVGLLGPNLNRGAKAALPLFRNGRMLGGIGVAGASTNDRDLDIALAGLSGFEAPEEILATRIFLDGIAIPFGRTSLANPAAVTTAFAALPAQVIVAPRDTPATPPEFAAASFGGVSGLIKNAIVNSNDGIAEALTAADVRGIIERGVVRARTARAGIRRPLGAFVVIHLVVVDRTGDILGAFAMDDATNFSYDVAVQKARTCAFFSNAQIGFGGRSIGFVAQPFFPAGLEGPGGVGSEPPGPLFGLQEQFNPRPVKGLGLDNGFQIFAGGLPLYRNGVLVGGVGVSGDGIDQDDLVAESGAVGFEPPAGVRADEATDANIIAALNDALNRIENGVRTPPNVPQVFNAQDAQDILNAVSTSRTRLNSASFADSLGQLNLPYLKRPRNPDL